MSIAEEMNALADALLQVTRARDAAACAALFTADGAIYSPYAEPAQGPEAIEALHQAWLDEGETNKQMTVLEAGGSGDTAYLLLAYSGDYPQADGSTLSESGRSLNLCRRQPDGSWRIHICSLNSDEPPLAPG